MNSRNSMKTAPVQGSIFSGYLRISAKEQLGDTFVQPINFTRVTGGSSSSNNSDNDGDDSMLCGVYLAYKT
ncbi:unnamed protein product, partial [Trichobilharzia regenti]